MTPSRARARIRAAEERLAAPPPDRLDGQTTIALAWVQGTLWGDPPPPAAPTPPTPSRAPVASRPRRQPRPPRRRTYLFDFPARPATRPRRDYVARRRITDVPLTVHLL
ncbi:hypothetical protein [Streptomyces sp. DH12]|uniref:hypothetical protein n=1 Tax=Streptomyces sp. DH12 TaxID=2857010 RepID=UPI001E2F608A|nr:hypothetical protein [Streptomyces sp. DH12]